LLIEGVGEQLAAVMEEAVGKDSVFEAKEGYHADTLRPLVTETFPRGWEELVPIPGWECGGVSGSACLAAVKLQAGRSKDLEPCATLFTMGRLDLGPIQERLLETRMDDRLRVLTTERLNKVVETAAKKNR